MVALILGLGLYFISELLVRRISFDVVGLGSFENEVPNYHWECWKDIVIIISPGYWLARYYKGRIKEKQGHLPCHLALYIKNNNTINLWFSAAVFFILSVVMSIGMHTDLLMSFVVWRFLSRSFEIAYAFGNDAINGHANQSSNLTKYDRIRLAMKSYVEIYLYSACLYMVVQDNGPVEALKSSLSVGTFTNVNQVLGGPLISFAVFLQVITTLSLVVLSLAVYVSRKE